MRAYRFQSSGDSARADGEHTRFLVAPLDPMANFHANRLASADGDTAIRIYDAGTGTLRATASDLLRESLALDLSADGKTLFVGEPDQTLSVIEALSRTIRDTLPKQSGTQRGIGDSDVGKQITAIYNLPKRFDDAGSGVVLLWDLGTRAPCAQDSNNPAWPFSGEPLRKVVFSLSL
jgi:hypothetical protein